METKDGSLFKVPLTTILEIKPHSNADSLEFAVVYGFHVIVKKGSYKVGDKVVYVPIDSILPPDLEAKLFPVGSKIVLHHSRIRQIKIRGQVSQGMLISPEDLNMNLKLWSTEEDLSETLGITKYEPPCTQKGPRASNPRNKPLENPRFHKYGGVDNIKWLPHFFDGQEVVVQEKLHGSNCRASYTKTAANTLWKKIKKLFKMLPEYEYCYGSNNVQLQERRSYTGFYGEDVYGKVLQKVNAFLKLNPGETIYGELIGPGIQKGYDYGLTEHHFVLFDVKKEKEDGSQEFIDPCDMELFAKSRGFDIVPTLYSGIYDAEKVRGLASGASVYCPSEKVREGIVIKYAKGYGQNGGKKALKLINEDYLSDSSNTDNH